LDYLVIVPVSSQPSPTNGGPLPLTGERTVPGIPEENYWFRRHEVAYSWIKDQVRLAHHDVLEAGCGEGYGADLLQRAGANVTAIDYDASAIRHIEATYPAVRAEQGNLADLNLRSDSMDIVVSLQVIEHLWDLGQFLRDIYWVLHAGGTAILSTPNRLTFSPGVGRGEKPTNPFHVEEFDGAQLAGLLTGAGFAEVEILGISHASDLTERETVSGSIVQRQVNAILAQDWPASLRTEVAGISVDDFVIRPHNDDALDLLAVARK
jgi:SAM-dependent methyltransferase